MLHRSAEAIQLICDSEVFAVVHKDGFSEVHDAAAYALALRRMGIAQPYLATLGEKAAQKLMALNRLKAALKP